MNRQRGVVLLTSLIVFTIVLSLGLVLSTRITTQSKVLKRWERSTKAFYLAEAGVERVIATNLKSDPNRDWSDNNEENLYLGVSLDGGRYWVSLRNGGKDRITIVAKGIYEGIERRLQVIIAADWERTPPQLKILTWIDE